MHGFGGGVGAGLQEMEAAAVKIQAIQKGRKARQEVDVLKSDSLRKAEKAGGNVGVCSGLLAAVLGYA